MKINIFSPLLLTIFLLSQSSIVSFQLKLELQVMIFSILLSGNMNPGLHLTSTITPSKALSVLISPFIRTRRRGQTFTEMILQ